MRPVTGMPVIICPAEERARQQATTESNGDSAHGPHHMAPRAEHSQVAGTIAAAENGAGTVVKLANDDGRHRRRQPGWPALSRAPFRILTRILENGPRPW